MTITDIQRAYDAEGETLGIERKARKRIIKQLISEGWIRIRRYMRQDTFTVNIFRIDKKTKTYLYQWAIAMRDLGLGYSQVRLDTPDQIHILSIDDIVEGVTFLETHKYSLDTVHYVKDL